MTEPSVKARATQLLGTAPPLPSHWGGLARASRPHPRNKISPVVFKILNQDCVPHLWPESRVPQMSGRWVFQHHHHRQSRHKAQGGRGSFSRALGARSSDRMGPWLPPSSSAKNQMPGLIHRAPGRFQPLLSGRAFMGIHRHGEDTLHALRDLTGTQTLFITRAQVEMCVVCCLVRQRVSNLSS